MKVTDDIKEGKIYDGMEEGCAKLNLLIDHRSWTCCETNDYINENNIFIHYNY